MLASVSRGVPVYSPSFAGYSFPLPTEGWLGLSRLAEDLVLRPNTVTHRATNRAWCRVTALIETDVLPAKPNRQPSTYVVQHRLRQQ